MESHIRNVYTNANRTLGFLRQFVFLPQDAKGAAYESLVRQIFLRMEARFGILIIMVLMLNWRMCKSVQLGL